MLRLTRITRMCVAHGGRDESLGFICLLAAIHNQRFLGAGTDNALSDRCCWIDGPI